MTIFLYCYCEHKAPCPTTTRTQSLGGLVLPPHRVNCWENIKFLFTIAIHINPLSKQGWMIPDQWWFHRWYSKYIEGNLHLHLLSQNQDNCVNTLPAIWWQSNVYTFVSQCTAGWENGKPCKVHPWWEHWGELMWKKVYIYIYIYIYMTTEIRSCIRQTV